MNIIVIVCLVLFFFTKYYAINQNVINFFKPNSIRLFFKNFTQKTMSGSNLPNFYFLINELQNSNQAHLAQLHEKTVDLQKSKHELRKSLEHQSRLELDLTTARKQNELSKEAIRQLRDQVLDQQQSLELLSREVTQNKDQIQRVSQLKSEIRNLKRELESKRIGQPENNMIYLMGPSYASDFERLQVQVRMTVENLRAKAQENEHLQKCLDSTLKEIQVHTAKIKSLSSTLSCSRENSSSVVEAAVGNGCVSVMTMEAVTQISDMNDIEEMYGVKHFAMKETILKSDDTIVEEYTSSESAYESTIDAQNKVKYLDSLSTSPTSLTDSSTIPSARDSIDTPKHYRRQSSDMPFNCHGTALQRELQRKIQHIRSKYT